VRLLFLLCLVPTLFGHLLIDIFGELKVSAGEVSLVITTDRKALLIAIKRGDLTLDRDLDPATVAPAIEQYLRDHLSLSADGAVSAPTVAFAPNLAVGGKEHNPSDSRLTFIASWHVGEAQQLRLTTRIFTGLNFPAIFQIRQPGTSADEVFLQPGEGCDVARTAATLVSHGEEKAPAVQQQNRFIYFLKLGFLHIVPQGPDHILFILGLYLLCRRIKPLLLQITAFTLAHSLTLALSLLDVVSLDPRIIEPLILLSIVFVAVENIFVSTMKPWRWLVVFCFGLIHGLGFAASIKGLFADRQTDFASALIGFNLGVEGAQLTVVAGAAALSAWFWHRDWYRRWLVLPASLAIAATALWWTIELLRSYRS
jgi:hypothetical protein